MQQEILRGIYEFLKPQVEDSIQRASLSPDALHVLVSEIERWEIVVEESRHLLDTGSQHGIIQAIGSLFEQAFEKGWCEEVAIGPSQIFIVKESKIWVIRFKRVK